jgi:hypothetical protein
LSLTDIIVLLCLCFHDILVIEISVT